MVTKYVLGTLEHSEHLHTQARASYLTAYKTKYPDSQTRIKQNHKDRITGKVADTVIQLSVDGKDHSDRLDAPNLHPDYPTTDKVIYSYDSNREHDPLKKDYHFKPSQRGALEAHAALTDLSEDEAKDHGFNYDHTVSMEAMSLTKLSPVNKITDLVLWLETTSIDNFNESGGTISKWYDINPLSTNKINLTQSTKANQPSYDRGGINELPALRFNKELENYLQGDFIETGKEITAFIVAKRLSICKRTSVFTTYNSANLRDYDSVDSFVPAYEELGDKLITQRFDKNMSTHRHPGNNKPYIFVTTFIKGNTNIAYLNGKKGSTVSLGTQYNFNINKLLVGARWNDGIKNYYDGNVGEIIIYNRYLSSSERIQIEEYLSKKWKINVKSLQND